MRQLPGKLYKILKRKNKSFFICKKMNKKLHKKKPFSLATCYYNNCKNPPIHYIVFATPHKRNTFSKKDSFGCLFFFLAYQ